MPYALFPTPLGSCALAWTERGITGVQLPEASDDETRARIASKGGDTEEAAPPKWVQSAAKSIALHLGGKRQDFAALKLDMANVPPFHARVYAAARDVEAGQTIGYGELAKIAGSPLAFRAVGQAMAKNPFPIVVPCHRVLAAGGKAGGFSAYGGAETKKRILALEGVALEIKGALDVVARPRSVATESSALESSAPDSSALQSSKDATLLDARVFDPEAAARALSAADAKLAAIIAKVGPLKLNVKSLGTPFEALAESIVYQQLTGKAAATIFGRVLGIYSNAKPRTSFTPKAVLATPDAQLRLAGLSGAKTAALKDLAAKTLDRTVPSMKAIGTMPEEELIARLTSIRGIGRWSVEMLLIFRLGRPDVLPVTDYGIRKGFAHAFRTKELPTPKEILAHGERWRPYRTAASWYLWRASELEANSRKAAAKAQLPPSKAPSRKAAQIA